MTKINTLLKGAFVTTIGVVSSIFFVSKYTIKPKNKTIPAFFTYDAPYIFVHRGGMAVRPELTKLAFDNAINYKIDGFETDVRLTKDNQLVVFHDATVDRTTNGSGKVAEHTLKELKRLDAGYYFSDINKQYVYRGHEDAKVLSFAELLTLYPNHLINVDLKDDPKSEQGQLAPQIMFEEIIKHHAQERVLVTSFHEQQIRRFNDISNGVVAIGASQNEVADGFIKFMSGLGNTYQGNANTFQMPPSFKGISLTSPKFISWLNQRNVIPGYYDVNNIDLMQDLINKGAHTIVTDNPELADRFKAIS
ncbi:glycerophosphodiester phosphodiesterase [Staphylococcus lloydii]|uniref:glycerophosphodiester phosphodiesterase n=1 Tax=Staphylococcus lloydii TaxID=2781774 RepID=UPI002929A244|nr:glycerophosphodiester phosphodiesterase [Staphylococcus lloydii]MDU9417401.1 glycerophosphodiester phosphodiesterase [Staphylococcus lloydii]